MSVLIEDRVAQESEARGYRHLEEVLQSKCFERATTLRGLLLYLWKNRDNEVSEYAIAVDALGRNEDFEPKIDATVRVQISRLRRLLTKYYESEGSQSAARLVIPLGTHQIQIVEASPEAEPKFDSDGDRESGLMIQAESVDYVVPISFAAGTPGTMYRLLVPAMASTIVVLLVCLGWALWPSLHRNNRNPVVAKRELPLFWKTFMDNGRPTRLVLPTPVFFSWQPPGGAGSLMVRDISVNDFKKSADSDQITELEKRLGKPRRWQNYTVASDTFASLRLARFLDSYGVQTSISSSAESPHEIIDHENVIAFGTTSSLAAYQSDLDRLSYKLGPHEAYIVDKRMPAGSPGQFPSLTETASRSVLPGLVALLPRGPSGSRIMLVQGAQTTALISWLISEDGMREVTQAQANQGHSPYFEAVVLSEVNEGNPIQSRMVAYRPFVEHGSGLNQVNEAAVTSRPLHSASR